MAMIAKALVPARRLAMALTPLVLLAACAQPADEQPAGEQTASEEADSEPPSGTAERNGASESIIPAEFKALGTEPFWALTSTGTGTAHSLRYSAPGNIEGTLVTIQEESAAAETRRITGTLDDEPFTLVLTVEQCSDGMSDRDYPFAARIVLGDETLSGCARPVDS